MSSSLLLRLVLIVSVVLVTEVLLIPGLELEEDRVPLEGRVSSIGRFTHPQIYNLYLEPVRKGASFQPEKRSRLFVGKRISDDYPSDEEDLVLLSDDNDDLFDVKRNHLFVGKRASPRFVGKRSVTNQMSRMRRKKRYAPNEYGRGGKMEDSNEGPILKLWMTEEARDEQSKAAEKRSRMFVGKRRELEADDKKRSRLFVGRRAEVEDEDENMDSLTALPVEVELSEEDAAKRSRLFVGKRPFTDHSSLNSAEHYGAGEEPGEMHTRPGAVEAPATNDKRVHLFPGKRPAPGFVGKRENQK